METIAISKFKATCLAVLERVRTTGKPVLVTRFGKPIAEIAPATAEPPRRKLGFMKDTPGLGQLELEDFEGLWDAEETVREWDELHAGPATSRKRRERKSTSR